MYVYMYAYNVCIYVCIYRLKPRIEKLGMYICCQRLPDELDIDDEDS